MSLPIRQPYPTDFFQQIKTKLLLAAGQWDLVRDNGFGSCYGVRASAIVIATGWSEDDMQITGDWLRLVSEVDRYCRLHSSILLVSY